MHSFPQGVVRHGLVSSGATPASILAVSSIRTAWSRGFSASRSRLWRRRRRQGHARIRVDALRKSHLLLPTQTTLRDGHLFSWRHARGPHPRRRHHTLQVLPLHQCIVLILGRFYPLELRLKRKQHTNNNGNRNVVGRVVFMASLATGKNVLLSLLYALADSWDHVASRRVGSPSSNLWYSTVSHHTREVLRLGVGTFLNFYLKDAILFRCALLFPALNVRAFPAVIIYCRVSQFLHTTRREEKRFPSPSMRYFSSSRRKALSRRHKRHAFLKVPQIHYGSHHSTIAQHTCIHTSFNGVSTSATRVEPTLNGYIRTPNFRVSDVSMCTALHFIASSTSIKVSKYQRQTTNRLLPSLLPHERNVECPAWRDAYP